MKVKVSDVVIFLVMATTSALYAAVGAWPIATMAGITAGLYLSSIVRAIDQRKHNITESTSRNQDERIG